MLNKSDSNLTALFSFDNSINTYKMNALWQSPWVDTASSGLLVTYQQEQTTTTIPSGCTVQIQYRTANATNFSDATSWSNTSFNLSGRFIQSQAVLTRDFSATQSPSVSNIAVTPDMVGQDIVTNLLASNVSTATAGAAFISAGSGTTSNGFDSTIFWEGTSSLKTTTDGTSSSQGVYAQYTTTTQGTFTGSLYAIGSASVYCQVRANYTDGTSTTINSTPVTLNGQWQRLSATVTSDSSKTLSYYQVFIRTNGNIATTFWTDGWQLEKRAYASPWVLGGTTAPRPKSVMIEEGTTNLVQNGSVETNSLYWSSNIGGGGAGSIARITNDGAVGTSCMECNVTSAAGWCILQNDYYSYAGSSPFTPGQTYTLSFWARKTSPNTPNVYVAIMASNATAQVMSSQYLSLTNQWKRFSFTFTASIAGTNPEIYFGVGGTPSSGAVGSYRVDGVQLETKSYATSYTDYGVVRSADLLTIPTSGNINFNSCTIITKAYFDGIATQTNPSLDNYLFRFANGSNALYLIRDTKFRLINNSGAQTNVDGTKVASTPGWYTVGVRFSTTEASIWVNGVKTGTTTNPNLPSVHGTLNIGCFNSGAGYWNNFIEDFNIFHEALTDAEMATYTAASGYIPLTEKHSYKLGFENQLVHGEGGYRIGNVYDLTQLGTIASSYIASTQNALASSTVVIETTTDNGVTWYPITQSGAITGLTSGVSGAGKTFKVRQKFTTTNPASVPSVADYTVKIGQQTSGTTGYIKPLFNKLVVTPTGITKWQLENKKYATSFIAGTRQNEIFSVPTSGVFHDGNGSVVIKAYVSGEKLSASTSRLYALFEYTGTSDGFNQIIVHRNSGNTWVLQTRDGTTATSNSWTNTLTQGWHIIGARWSSTEASLWIDGVKVITISNPKMPTSSSNPLLKFGHRYNGTNQWNDLIDAIDIFGESLTDAEMAAYTTSGTVLTEKHTYKLTFDNQNLNYAGTGIWYSDWLDAGSNCADTPWLAFESTYNKPDGTDIKYYFRASNTGSTSDATAWVTDITQITGRFLQIKAVLISNDVVNTTPSITYMEATAKFS